MATGYYAKLDRPEIKAGKMLVQAGSAKFVKKSKTVTIATEFANVRFFDAKFTRPRTCKLTAAAVLACTGTVSSHKLVITRTTLGGTMSGATFWYYIVGF